MKRSFATYIPALITLVFLCQGLKSQNLFLNAGGERIQACSDRTMFVSGEKIRFTALVYNTAEHFNAEFSRVFYCELITSEGKKIIAGKYLLKNSCGQGCITIPQETVSGIYFLKFYTRFMRNISTAEYKYIKLKIINPYKTEVLAGNESNDTILKAGNSFRVLQADPNLTVRPDKKTYSARGAVELDLSGRVGNKSPAVFCLSVIPENTYEDASVPVKIQTDTAIKGAYNPETRGVSLSGQLIARETGKAVPDSKVSLSVIGDKDILVARTDSSGKFYFSMPDYSGNRDIFLYAGDQPGTTPEILIDNDFSFRPVGLPSLLFTLDKQEKKAAYNLAVNYKITFVYREDTTAGKSQQETNDKPFYGKPSQVLVFEKYIDLPTLEEYFTQLPGMVSLRKVQGKKQFRFFSTQEEMLKYDPLVLVDWVAVSDMEKILAMPPSALLRIELVNSVYIKGNITYGGIISFVSRKNDFAGIDLPKSGTFVSYGFLEECNGIVPPGPVPANIPDSRNTVYWNPNIQMNDQGAAGVSFPAPDTPGKYYILLREMTTSGEIILTKDSIDVKDK